MIDDLTEQKKELVARTIRSFGGSDKPSKIQSYLEQVEDIPLEALREVLTNIEQTFQKMPKPVEIKQKYKEWIKKNPQKIAWVSTDTCPDCGGKGFFEYEYFSPTMRQWYLTMAFCAKCRPNSEPKATKEELDKIINIKPNKVRWYVKKTYSMPF